MLATLVLAAALAAPPSAPETKEAKLDFAVENAAREFRIQTYEAFRQRRDEYDARRALGDELLKAWNKAAQPARHREAVLAWFEEAKLNSQAGSNLEPYAELEDLQSLVVSEPLPSAESEAAPASEKDGKLPPPFILDLPKNTEETADAVKSIFTRVKVLFSGKSTPAPAPAPEPAADDAK
jgi:hypothetical protein